MDRSHLQLSVTALLATIACVALNLWLFRLGMLWGIIGLNVTKHVAVAYLCRVTGVNRVPDAGPPVLWEFDFDGVGPAKSVARPTP